VVRPLSAETLRSAELSDPTAGKDILYTATSRMGHALIGVYAKTALPYLASNTPQKLCEFRSENGHYIDTLEDHAAYIAQAQSTKNVVVRGRYLVDGHGNRNSYCTHIQENLRALHFTCAYMLLGTEIWIVQTATIAANEELSIQFSHDCSYWKERQGYHPTS
jgi:hypothetical protein